MHHGAGRVGSLERLLRRGESGIHARVVDHQGASLRICDQFGRAALQVPLGYVGRLARTPRDLHEIGRSAGGDEAVRIDHDPARRGARRIIQSEALNVAGQALRRGIVDRDHLGVVAGGWNFGTGVDHAFHHRVEAIASRRRWSSTEHRAPDVSRPIRRRLAGGLIGIASELLGRVGPPQIAARHDIAVEDRLSFGLRPRRCVPCNSVG